MAKFYNVCLTAVAMIVGAASLQARPLVVAGNLLTSDSQGAVYEITSDGSKTILTNPAYATSYAASGGGCYNDGKYYMSKIWMSGYSSQTYTFDTSEIPWKSVESDGQGASSVLSTDYSYDVETNLIYGFVKNYGSNYRIAKITPGASWSTRYVQVQVGTDMKDVTIDCSDADNKWHGIAFDADNQLWVITYGGSLNKVDKNTGVMTLVGETGVKPTVNGSAAFDFKTGKLYWAVKNAEGSAVYEVNTSTAEATKVLDVPENLQLMGLFVPKSAAEDAAPAAPANVHYDLVDGSLDGSVVFDIPATTFDDTPAEGEVTYSVTVGEGEPVTGTAAFGQNNVAVPFTANASGLVSVIVYLENEVGKSPTVKYEAYVGYGVPVAPGDVTLTYSDGKMMVSWDIVSEVVDGLGYIGDVKYNVIRKINGEDETVAEGIEINVYEEDVEEPEAGMCSYSYSVVAVNGDQVSAASSSSAWTLGSVSLPYDNDFSTEEDFNSLTNINCEPSSKSWVWSKSSGYVSISYDKSYAKDDWLISPPFKIEKDYEYTVSVDAKSQNSRYPEKLGISWGYEPTADGMSEVLVAGDEDVPATFTSVSGKFVAPSDCVVYAGIHACSDMDMSTLMVDNFSIKKGVLSKIDVVPVSEFSISVNDLNIIVEGNGVVAISSLDGISIAKFVNKGSMSIPVMKGIYIVSYNGHSEKVLVKYFKRGVS